jgi:hypothetical protein
MPDKDARGGRTEWTNEDGEEQLPLGVGDLRQQTSQLRASQKASFRYAAGSPMTARQREGLDHLVAKQTLFLRLPQPRA